MGPLLSFYTEYYWKDSELQSKVGLVGWLASAVAVGLAILSRNGKLTVSAIAASGNIQEAIANLAKAWLFNDQVTALEMSKRLAELNFRMGPQFNLALLKGMASLGLNPEGGQLPDRNIPQNPYLNHAPTEPERAETAKKWKDEGAEKSSGIATSGAKQARDISTAAARSVFDKMSEMNRAALFLDLLGARIGYEGLNSPMTLTFAGQSVTLEPFLGARDRIQLQYETALKTAHMRFVAEVFRGVTSDLDRSLEDAIKSVTRF